jgi:3'-5' exoribonuclease
MMADKLRCFPDFPVELRNLIEHMVLSHHGQLEFGSPKIPIFPEALLLHYLDDLDSKMECMRVQIDRDPQAEGYFSAYSPSLGRVSLRKTRYLASNPAGTPHRCTPGSDPADDVDAAGADAAAGVASDSGLSVNNHSTHNTVSNSSTPIPSGRLPAPALPNTKPAPASNSVFGAKLQQALHDERK